MLYYTVIFGIWVCLLILASVTGNLMVCLAIYHDARLRRPENFFIGSLAVADLLVATLVMPSSGVNDVLNRCLFGPAMSDVWIAMNIMCCTASILNLCVISLDRYLHIKDPFKYPGLVTKRVALSSIAMVWALSALISVLPISLGLHQSSTSQRSQPPQQSQPPTCNPEFSPFYAVASSTVSFYLPCLVMVSIYCRLYIYSRRHLKMICELCPGQPPPREHKAAITLGIVMGIFLICWLPFFCANVLAPFCNYCVSPETFVALSWLAYCNSMFNPIVYTVLNSEFRNFFRRIMRTLSTTISVGTNKN